MKSTVVKRSIVLAGHKTSVSLEDAFWRGLKRACRDVDFADPHYASGMTILRRRYRQILRPCDYLAKLADGLCRYFDV